MQWKMNKLKWKWFCTVKEKIQIQFQEWLLWAALVFFGCWLTMDDLFHASELLVPEPRSQVGVSIVAVIMSNCGMDQCHAQWKNVALQWDCEKVNLYWHWMCHGNNWNQMSKNIVLCEINFYRIDSELGKPIAHFLESKCRKHSAKSSYLLSI